MLSSQGNSYVFIVSFVFKTFVKKQMQACMVRYFFSLTLHSTMSEWDECMQVLNLSMKLYMVCVFV